MKALRAGESHGERAGHEPTTVQEWATVGSVLVLAFAARLAVVLWLSDTHPYSDYYYYHQAGRLSAEDWGLWFDAERILQLAKLSWWPPGYPVFLGVLYEIFGANHRVAAFAHVVLGTIVCGLVYLIARGACRRRVALGAALWIALDPHYLFTTNLVASENLFVVWFALGLWLAMRPWTRARDPVAVGVALALASLTRAVALLLPVVVLLWKRRQANRPAQVDASMDRVGASRGHAFALVAAFALVILPWSVRNWSVVGEPALVSYGGGLNFYFGHNEQDPVFRDVSQTPMAGLRTPGAIDRRGWQLGLRHVLRDPAGELGRTLFKLRELFDSPRYALQANNAVRRPEGWRYDPAIAALAEEARERQRVRARYLRGILGQWADAHTWLTVLGALAALFLWRRFTNELRFIAWVAVYWVVVHMVFWAQPRFRYPLEIPMAILAFFALGTLMSALRSRWRARSAPRTE